MTTTDQTISAAFRAAFEAHPSRDSDPALAIDSARETAAELIPSGTVGKFDDESLTFAADGDETRRRALPMITVTTLPEDHRRLQQLVRDSAQDWFRRIRLAAFFKYADIHPLSVPRRALRRAISRAHDAGWRIAGLSLDADTAHRNVSEYATPGALKRALLQYIRACRAYEKEVARFQRPVLAGRG